MKKKTKAFIILGLILICILGGYAYVSSMYNNLVSEEESVEMAWSDVQSVYQRRLDLIPGITASVKSKTPEFVAAFNDVTKARKAVSLKVNGSSQILNNEEEFSTYINEQKHLGDALKGISNICKASSELSSNQTISSLMEQLESTEKKLAAAQKDYNQAAKEYNSHIRKIPVVFFASYFEFHKKAYIKAE